MDIPEEVKKVFVWFDFEYLDLIPEGEDQETFALKHATKEEQQVVRKFIDGVLNANYGARELQDILRRTSARILIPDERGLRWFFLEVRNRIDNLPPSYETAERSPWGAARFGTKRQIWP